MTRNYRNMEFRSKRITCDRKCHNKKETDIVLEINKKQFTFLTSLIESLNFQFQDTRLKVQYIFFLYFPQLTKTTLKRSHLIFFRYEFYDKLLLPTVKDIFMLKTKNLSIEKRYQIYLYRNQSLTHKPTDFTYRKNKQTNKVLRYRIN